MVSVGMGYLVGKKGDAQDKNDGVLFYEFKIEDDPAADYGSDKNRAANLAQDMEQEPKIKIMGRDGRRFRKRKGE